MEVVVEKYHAAELLMMLNDLERVQFISLKNYRNQEGELSDYVLIAGFDYERARQKDIVRLMSVSYEGLKEVARREMLAALDDNSNAETRSAASQAQIDAYRHIGKNSKIHIASMSVKIWAFCRAKKVLEPVTYKPVKSRELTILKNRIKKELRMSTPNYRCFTLKEIVGAKISGQHLEIVHS